MKYKNETDEGFQQKDGLLEITKPYCENMFSERIKMKLSWNLRASGPSAECSRAEGLWRFALQFLLLFS